MEHVGLVVNRLIRISYGPFRLGELAAGAVEEIRPKVLRDQLGIGLADPEATGTARPAARAAKRGGPGKPRSGPGGKPSAGSRPARGPAGRGAPNSGALRRRS
jgi:23S rRNA pseudouridine2605 synthase